MKVSAIIPAAGKGTRIGAAVPKQFLLLNGKPILSHTIEVFEKCGLVDSLILVGPKKEVETELGDWPNQSSIVREVVVGGEKRQDSVYNGFQAVDADTDIVIVHDGVRPFVTAEMIKDSVEAANQYGAAIVAVPVSDTIKQSNPDGFIERTVDREGLWRVQTPQAFQYGLLKEALEKASADSFYGTDEGSLVERLGKKIKIVPGSELNIKITRQEDLALGESILGLTAPPRT
ncbi:MAG: 2-C-methyl-D-erythritol 4-phosphate cytidylyltransferase [Nitrospinaceae bacterium]